MCNNTLLLIAPKKSATDDLFINQIIAQWQQTSAMDITAIDFNQAQPENKTLQQAAIVWIIIPDRANAHSDKILQLLDELHIPAVISIKNEKTLKPGDNYVAGVGFIPWQTTPDLACAILAMLLTQKEKLTEIDLENRILRAQHRGIQKQIQIIDEEMKLAAQLQQEILPQAIPQLHDFAFEVLYRPATYVSGDIYNIERLDEDHIGFFIADAVGHGVPAALLTMIIKQCFRMKETHPQAPHGYRIIPPNQALARLNRAMIDFQSGKVRFATAACCLLNTKTQQLTFARAGHPFPFLLKANGQKETFSPQGPLLGVFPDAVFETHTCQLQYGDRFLLYTDGFEMSFPDEKKPEQVANLAYQTIFEKMSQGTVQEAIAYLNQKLDNANGSLHQKDDLTAVLLGYGIAQTNQNTTQSPNRLSA